MDRDGRGSEPNAKVWNFFAAASAISFLCFFGRCLTVVGRSGAGGRMWYMLSSHDTLVHTDTHRDDGGVGSQKM